MHPTRPGPPVTDAPGPPFYGGPDTPVCKQIKKGGRFHFTNPHRPGQSSAQHGHERKKKKKWSAVSFAPPQAPGPDGEVPGKRLPLVDEGDAEMPIHCAVSRAAGNTTDSDRCSRPSPSDWKEGQPPPPQRRRPPARHLRALPGGDQAASWAARPCERTTGCLSLGTKSSRKALGSWGCAGGPHRTSSTRKPLKQAHTRRRLGKFGREQRSRGPRKGVTLSPPCPRSAFSEEPVSEAVNSASQAEPQLLR